ncbi:hypothetical protein [Roseateles sp.]|uniref:hypothetical protein n=1 Tax=Roseateles sp. TaxID=1971397 RepID=UPI0031E367DF
MTHPGVILLIGLFTELLVQFGKRFPYWLSNETALHYVALLAGDLVFLGLFGVMVSRIRWTRRHTVVTAVFAVLFLLSVVLNGPAAAIVSTRSTYLWVLATTLMCVSYPQMSGGDTRSLLGAGELMAWLLGGYAVIQVASDYAFEKPWFKLSGTSLVYEGVTNFGQAAKAFSLLSGPTDFAAFALFVFAIGFAGRRPVLWALGLFLLYLSGTRGILMSLPLWMLLARVAGRRVVPIYFVTLAGFLSLMMLFSEELIALLYAMPNSRFSLATLAPRIVLWTQLDASNFATGGGLAVNLSDSLVDAPTVLDSGLLYFCTEIGVPATLALLSLFLTVARVRRGEDRRDALGVMLGTLVISSLVQIPFHTRLPNFLLCVAVYAAIHRAQVLSIHPARRLAQA